MVLLFTVSTFHYVARTVLRRVIMSSASGVCQFAAAGNSIALIPLPLEAAAGGFGMCGLKLDGEVCSA